MRVPSKLCLPIAAVLCLGSLVLQYSNALAKFGISHAIDVFETRLNIHVSAIIITNGSAPLFSKCLKTLAEQKVHGFGFEVMIADSSCRPETIGTVRSIRNAQPNVIVKHIRFCTDMGYSEGNNRATAFAEKSSKYYVFLNDDMVLRAGFLQSMFDLAESKDHVGGVGCKLIDLTTGVLAEAGSLVWRDGSAMAYGRGHAPTDGRYNFVRPVDYCSGACLLVPREVFAAVGGFDGIKYKAYYEDTDLQMKITSRLGKAIYFQPLAEADHQGHGTFGGSAAVRLTQEGQAKFVQRWQLPLRNHAHPNFEESGVLEASDSRRTSVPRIAYFDQLLPRRNFGAGFGRSFDNVLILAKLGYRLTIVGVEEGPPRETISLQDRITLQQSGVEIYEPNGIPRQSCLPGLSLFRKRKFFYTTCIVSRPFNPMFDCMEDLRVHCPTIVYDAEALFMRRDELYFRFIAQRGTFTHEQYIDVVQRSAQMGTMRTQELSQLHAADSIMFASVSDMEYVRSELPEVRTPMFVAGHVAPAFASTSLGNRFHDRDGILFVGSFDGQMYYNGDAILWFITEVYPAVMHAQSISLKIAGRSIPQDLRDVVQQSRYARWIELLDSPGEEALRMLYHKSRLFIAPHQYAAGVQQKLSEALSFGLPCAVSALGAGGFGIQALAQDAGFCVGDSPQAFAQCVAKLHGDANTWNSLHHSALRYIRTTHTPSIVAKALALAVGENATGPIQRESFQEMRTKGCKNGEALYLTMYPEVAEEVKDGCVHSAWQHFLRKGADMGRVWKCGQPPPPKKTCYYGEKAYSILYPDVAAAVKTHIFPSALSHYKDFGWMEGRVWNCYQPFLQMMDERGDDANRTF
mmetsp:Transcript_82619/g.230394  ORF Transcript_82619/g.230394 Transcript_82619/m.230394 type:complete len:856 (-) Transcript_82619:89-2656(-)